MSGVCTGHGAVAHAGHGVGVAGAHAVGAEVGAVGGSEIVICVGADVGDSVISRNSSVVVVVVTSNDTVPMNFSVVVCTSVMFGRGKPSVTPSTLRFVAVIAGSTSTERLLMLPPS